MLSIGGFFMSFFGNKLPERNEIAVVYCRVSTDGQAERGTIESQITYAKDYAKFKGFEIKDFYCDDGVTGMMPLAERPEGKRLTEDAKAGKFNVVYVYKIDRLGRSARETLNAIYSLKESGVILRSLTETFDLETPMGQFFMQLLANIADLDRNNFLERSRLGTERLVKAGKWVGGIVPYGYEINDAKELVLNTRPFPDSDLCEAEVVRMIFDMVGKHNKSSVEVARLLNALGVPTSYSRSTGKRRKKTIGIWRSNTVLRIIRNTTYKGIHYYGKRSGYYSTPIAREVTPIVDEKIWEQANAEIDKNRKSSFRVPASEYMLAGLIKCGVCGANYSGTRNNRDGAYYRCSSRMRKHKIEKNKCNSRYVNSDLLESIVWNELIDLLGNKKTLRAAVKNSLTEMEKKQRNIDPDIEKAEKALQDKELEKARLIQLYTKGTLNEEDVVAPLDDLKNELEGLSEHLSSLMKEKENIDKAQIIEKEDIDLYVDKIREFLSECDDPKTKKRLIQTLVKKITVISPTDRKKPIEFDIEFRLKVPAHKVYSDGAKNHTDTDSSH